MNIPVIAENDISIQAKQIGVGAYGQIRQGYWKSKDMAVAIKITNEIEKEAKIWMALDDKNIIKFFGIAHGSVDCMVIELAQNGSLHSFFEPQKENNLIDYALAWIIHVAKGVQYLHRRNIIHRDLKSKNVVITADMAAKLCDFGTSRIIEASTIMTMAGSIPWMSPEIVRNDPVNELTDTWSFGVLVWETLIRETPYEGLDIMTIIYNVGKNRIKLNLPNSCPNSMKWLIRRCIDFTRDKRPSLEFINVSLSEMTGEKDKIQEFMRKKEEWKDFGKYTVTDMDNAENQLESLQHESKVLVISPSYAYELTHPFQSWTAYRCSQPVFTDLVCVLNKHIYTIGTATGGRTKLRAININSLKEMISFGVGFLTVARERACACTSNGCLYVFGGKDPNTRQILSSIEIYYQNTNSVALLNIVGLPGCVDAACTAVTYNGSTQIWIIGGRDNYNKFSNVVIYYPNTTEWLRGPDLLHEIESHACVYHNGKVIISGGIYRHRALCSVQAFDLDTNKLIKMPSMNEARCRHGMTVMANKLYVIGGANPYDDQYMVPTSIETLDLNNENAVWHIEPLGLPRPGATVARAFTIENFKDSSTKQ